VGVAPQVQASLSWADHFGTLKVRWGVGRMHYTVDPGLYAIGSPHEASPVLVTANYKLSFDSLREWLIGRSAWILVLDTKGVNVWCAAGKGTFGTAGLVGRVESCGLSKVVSHRRLILPQLAAPGIAAHEVKRLSGFEVVYGPIRAKDLAAFLEGGLKATPEMRQKSFTLWERTVLVPVEFVGALKLALIAFPILLVLGGLGGTDGFWVNAGIHGVFAAKGLLTAVLAGAVITPIALPWLPGRAFSLKGLSLGLLAALALGISELGRVRGHRDWMEIIAWLLITPAAASFFAMNFTGASTYTSLSGVRKEMRWAVPAQIGAVGAGCLLWLWSLFTA
jgi:hypothetical protein